MTTNQTTINGGFDSERTQYNLPQQETKTVLKPVKKSGQNTSGKVIALGSIGVIAGIAGAAGISAYTRAPGMSEDKVTFPSVDGDKGASAAKGSDASTAATDADTAAHDATTGAEANGTAALTPEQQDNVHSYGQAIYLPESFDEIGVAFSPDDSMSFAQAFSAARAEVGPHGVFAWHGGVFGTYYADEWNSLPEDYRTSFSNHDWSSVGDTQFVAEEVPAAPYEVGTDDNGRVYVMLVEAVTGEPVAYYPDGSLTPVLDEQGQVVALVDNNLVGQDTANALIIDPSGSVTMTDDPTTALIAMLASDQELMADTVVPEVDVDPESNVVEVITSDDDDVYVPEMIDEDAVVVELDDENYDVVEVLDDDDMVATVTDSVDANETFDDLPTDDMAAADGIEEIEI